MRLTVVIILLSLLTQFLYAQEPVQLKNKVELSAAFTYQSSKDKDDSERDWFFTIPVGLRYFFSQNVGIVGEVLFSDWKGEENTGIIFNFGLEADFPTPNNGVIPFVWAGYGISNGSFYIDRIAFKNYSDATLGVLNIGGGIKIPIAKIALGKIEVRYQKFSGKTDSGFEISTNYINGFFGFSLLL
jgi:hypothetical protein